ncbi:MAG: GGDEF domain-containing protein, partial [Candidatus Dormiibacterota bacterium]
FALLAIDVDDLKAVNDGYGHAAGDALLVAIGHVLASVARKGETLARIGGDEFVLLIPDASEEAPAVVARRAEGAVAGLNLPTGPARVSVGWASGAAGDDPYLVLQRADAQLYVAKTGKGGSGSSTRSLTLAKESDSAEVKVTTDGSNARE